jgi:hypothetical protein
MQLTAKKPDVVVGIVDGGAQVPEATHVKWKMSMPPFRLAGILYSAKHQLHCQLNSTKMSSKLPQRALLALLLLCSFIRMIRVFPTSSKAMLL